MEQIVFLNGRFVPERQAVISVEDRGNTFGDGVYEVVRIYEGRPFQLEAHLARLERSAAAIRLPLPMTPEEISSAARELIERNGCADASLYLQVSRGGAPRQHQFPDGAQPTVFMIARPVDPKAITTYRQGVGCISVEDRRWTMCHVKAITLLPNVLAKQAAKDAGAFEAIFVREGVVTEGSSSNVFAVSGKRLYTHPEGPFILSGVTRRLVIDLARRLGLEVCEAPFTLSDLKEADEVFLTSTVIEIAPVVRIDGQRVGKGGPGTRTVDLQQAFDKLKEGPSGVD